MRCRKLTVPLAPDKPLANVHRSLVGYLSHQEGDRLKDHQVRRQQLFGHALALESLDDLNHSTMIGVASLKEGNQETRVDEDHRSRS